MKIKYVTFKEAAKVQHSTVSMCDNLAYDFTVNKAERWIGITPKVRIRGLGLTIIPYENVKSIQTEDDGELANNIGAVKAKKDDPKA